MRRRLTDAWPLIRLWAQRGLFVLADVLAVAGSAYLAYSLRFDGVVPAAYLTGMVYGIPLAVCVKIPVFAVLRMYRFSWRHVGIRELATTVVACSIGSAVLAAAFFGLRETGGISAMPRSVLAIDWALCLLGIGGVRLAGRLSMLVRTGRRYEGEAGLRRAVIIGAGDAGMVLARSLREDAASRYVPVGFLDDDRAKWGLIIHGVRVLGGRQRLWRVVDSLHVDSVLIAVPSSGGSFVTDTVTRAREAGVQDIRILPPLSQLYSAQVHAAELREVTPEDVLRREPVRIDTTAIEQLVRGRSILVTGAAGSIGSELCRQVLRFGAGDLTCLDNDETGMFYLERDLKGRFPNGSISYRVGDVRDRSRVRHVIEHARPETVFHAAAYKHVPLMEQSAAEAVKTNVFGTRCVIEEACAWGTESFVLISTDKAVNPCSIMGATKRVAERITHSNNGRFKTRCMAVRFGNVLGSRGSVLPIFEEQIRAGGPVTITDPRMQRYFMVTSEAVLLVLQAAAMGAGGEVFVLDMGEPLSILELARDLIRSHGLEPDEDVPIVFTGMRPGERLFEELLTAEEGTDATTHEKVFVARLGSPWESGKLDERLERLLVAAERGDREEVVAHLRELVPSYSPCTVRDQNGL